LAEGEEFVLLGDLNSDPNEGKGSMHPVAKFLLQHPRVQGEFVPKVKIDELPQHSSLAEDDTSDWGMRVDYVLPSRGLKILGGGVHRAANNDKMKVSDHFPVWLELDVTTQ
jgi:endonuclease/exonuclease/phosphatase family metal-dependent hydrolase